MAHRLLLTATQRKEARTAAEVARDAAVNSQNGAKHRKMPLLHRRRTPKPLKRLLWTPVTRRRPLKRPPRTRGSPAENSEANAKTYKESAAESAATAQQYSGKPPKPENGTWWIWDAEKGTYVNTTISCELTGPTGNGIQSIQLTQGNHTPGSTDIYTVTMTDGSEYNIAVYNGLNGTWYGRCARHPFRSGAAGLRMVERFHHCGGEPPCGRCQVQIPH